MKNEFFDKQLRSIIRILGGDYAGLALKEEPADFQFYVQAAGVAWREGKLNQLLFLRYVNQMLATTGDRSLSLSVNSLAYEPFFPGFDVRRFQEELLVTKSWQEKRVRPGDKILRVNSLTPLEHTRHFQKNFLYSDQAEREIWGGVMKMASHVLVEHADGKREDMVLRRYHGHRPLEESFFSEKGEGILRIRLGSLVSEGAEKVLGELPGKLEGKKALIVDLRGTSSGQEEMLLPLVPMILCAPRTMDELVGEVSYRCLYTRANAERRLALLKPYEGQPAADEMIRDVQEKAGAGWVEESFLLWEEYPEKIIPWEGETILLTDTWTEGAAESLALWAKKEGRVRIIGRPTMGRLDFGDEIAVQISPTAVLRYPMSITREAAMGEGYLGKGVAPDQTIPFTEEECHRDVILEAALRELSREAEGMA